MTSFIINTEDVDVSEMKTFDFEELSWEMFSNHNGIISKLINKCLNHPS